MKNLILLVSLAFISMLLFAVTAMATPQDIAHADPGEVATLDCDSTPVAVQSDATVESAGVTEYAPHIMCVQIDSAAPSIDYKTHERDVTVYRRNFDVLPWRNLS